jgi:hypothetical protein
MDLRRLEEMDTGVKGKEGHVHEDAVADTTISSMYQGADWGWT